MDTAPALCQERWGFLPEKRMKDIVVYVLEFMLNVDKVQNRSTLM